MFWVTTGCGFEFPAGQLNQDVENAGVAFVKGSDERNKFFGKKKKSVMYDEHVRANKAKD